jgi:glutathione synthase/RimK-type ligase-like ATP-grasp enzyme
LKLATLAVEAVRALHLELGGVDILARDGGAYVLESNFPFSFQRAQLTYGFDIAAAIVDHLLRKAQTFPER